jgi:hypothetical protein
MSFPKQAMPLTSFSFHIGLMLKSSHENGEISVAGVKNS